MVRKRTGGYVSDIRIEPEVGGKKVLAAIGDAGRAVLCEFVTDGGYPVTLRNYYYDFPCYKRLILERGLDGLIRHPKTALVKLTPGPFLRTPENIP